jgi:hypothetical protein
MPEYRVVVTCNYIETARASSSGSKCYLIHSNPGGGNDRIYILARSRSGRWISRWENIKRLDNFRCKKVFPGHFIYSDERIYDYDPEKMVDTLTTSRAHLMGTLW